VLESFNSAGCRVKCVATKEEVGFLDVVFTSPVRYAGAFLTRLSVGGINPNKVEVYFFDEGDNILGFFENENVGSGADGYTFVGFDAESSLINTMRIRDPFAPNPGTDWVLIDDIIYELSPVPEPSNPIPEPSTMLLMGTGLVVLFLYVWRRERLHQS